MQESARVLSEPIADLQGGSHPTLPGIVHLSLRTKICNWLAVVERLREIGWQSSGLFWFVEIVGIVAEPRRRFHPAISYRGRLRALEAGICRFV